MMHVVLQMWRETDGLFCLPGHVHRGEDVVEAIARLVAKALHIVAGLVSKQI